MSNFQLFIHGTPEGHKIWGNPQLPYYFNSFYNKDSKSSLNVFTQIDICEGDAYYTCVHSRNLLDSEGRPGAFFALTISFAKAFCTNLHLLQRLFDALYDQICKKSFLQESGNGEMYRVRDFESAVFQSEQAVGKILSIVDKKIAEELRPYLKPLPSPIDDTFGDKNPKLFNVKEVDSPIFLDACLNHEVIVSPDIPLASSQLRKCSDDLRFALSQNNELEDAKDKLSSKVQSLTNETRQLTEQLEEATTTARSKYEARILELERQLDHAAAERDMLKAKIAEAVSAVDLMDKPFQQLSRLMAGRFPQEYDSHPEKGDGEAASAPKGAGKVGWRRWMNTILLALIFILSCITLFFTISSPRRPETDIEKTVAEITEANPIGETDSIATEPETDSIPAAGDEVE